MNKQIKTKLEEFRKAASDLAGSIIECEEIELHSRVLVVSLIDDFGKFIEDYLERRNVL